MDSASLIFAIIVLLIGLGISYFVIKCAVRNGINESLLFANKERGCGRFLGRSCDQSKAFAVLHGALPAQ